MAGEPGTENLSESDCWALLRTTSLGRLAVWLGDHPDIFPLNYAVDHGTVVFRSHPGTKMSAALAETPVALEADGYDPESNRAWSVVIRGAAEEIHRTDELLETVDLPLFPWQGGDKERFVRIAPTVISGRRFPVIDPHAWQIPLSDATHSPID